MNKAREGESAGYVTHPLQIRAMLVKLLQHSIDVAQSPGKRTSWTLRHDALHMHLPPGGGKAATEALEVSRRDGIV